MFRRHEPFCSGVLSWKDLFNARSRTRCVLALKHVIEREHLYHAGDGFHGLFQVVRGSFKPVFSGSACARWWAAFLGVVNAPLARQNDRYPASFHRLGQARDSMRLNTAAAEGL